MLRPTSCLFAALVFTTPALAQVTTTGAFVGTYHEEFETVLTSPFPSCLPNRIFSNNGDACTPLGPYCVETFGWLLYCSIYPHNGSNALFGSAQGPVEFTFDSPVRRLGGYFGTNGYLPGGTIHLYDPNDVEIANLPITAPACSWAWNGWDASATLGIKRAVVYANDPYNGGALMQMDDFEMDPMVPAGTYFCFGDGTGTACPCGNNSPTSAHAGCQSSLGVGGVLAMTGFASVSADSIVLQGSAMPNSSALYFQGSSTSGSGAGTVFGDGLRCAAGTVIRLGTKLNTGGASQYPGPGDASVSLRGTVSAGDTRRYQCWYRNAANFCTSSTFNLSNGVRLNWGA